MDQTSRIVLTTSLDPYLDPRLCPGAVRCLGLLRSLAGHSRLLHTLTASLATQLDRCTNTIRNYRTELVEAGYIWWTTDRRTGIVTVLIRGAVEPPSRRAALGLGGGAQFSAPIKSSIPLRLPSLPERAREKARLLTKWGLDRPAVAVMQGV
jgi:hypothetical protein